MWRQGDVFITAVRSVPGRANKQPHVILAQGEITGHAHRVLEPKSAEIWADGDRTFLRVLDDRATIVHDEHAAITLPQGVYLFWLQREYTPQAPRRVID
jgi:hypothetical protein